MAKLLLEPCNLLVLDEPTNHLDMRSKDILKKALLNYDGTLIAVSHDREFLDGLVNKVFEFGKQKIKEHLGGIYDFLAKKKLITLAELEKKDNQKQVPAFNNEPPSKQAFLDKKEFDREVRKLENQIRKVEIRIEELEREIGIFENKISDPAVDPESIKAPGFYATYEQLKEDLASQMSLWEQLHQDLELLKNKRI
jgi:ATP-binding cassette subfamily F protein 3